MRLSLLFFLCLIDGERSRFLMRLVNPSPGILFAAHRCDPGMIPPSHHHQTLHRRRTAEVYRVGQCSCCRDMWILKISWVCFTVPPPPLSSVASPAASQHFWTDVSNAATRTDRELICLPAWHQEFNLNLHRSHDWINDCFCCCLANLFNRIRERLLGQYLSSWTADVWVPQLFGCWLGDKKVIFYRLK